MIALRLPVRLPGYVLAALLFSLPIPAAWCAGPAFAVITSPSNSQHVSLESTALIYQRKLGYWEDGTRIQPVNLPPAHPLRQQFSQTILGHSPEAMGDYWREQYFHGVLPPHVLASEEAVILFVNATPGAIGYISGCAPEHGVHVVLTVGELPDCSH